jgi:hypothetical protein
LSSALAADYDLPILRSNSQPPVPVLTVAPATFTHWSGFYFGGNISLGSAMSEFSRATQPLVALSFQDTMVEDQFHPSSFQVLGRGSAVAAGGSAFLGYNMPQLRRDLVLGVEASYTHTNLNMTSPSRSVGRSFPFDVNSVPAGTVTDVKLHNASGHMDLTDYGEARGRAGYVVGNLLQYGFIGFAVGRADYSVSATTDATCITVPNTST